MLRECDHGQRLLFCSEAESRFERFHAENGHIYRMLREMALALRRAGHTRWGARNLYEKLRYDLAIQSSETSPVLNNDFCPFYARKLMAEEPSLANFFEVRERNH